MNYVYSPGCALMLHKPGLALKAHQFLSNQVGTMPVHRLCCRYNPELPSGTCVVNTCAGCDRRFRSTYEGVTTISLWEVIEASDTFPFPNYGGVAMAIQDACPTRSEDRVHVAVRRLLERMNIQVVEPANTRAQARCCGDTYFRTLSEAEVKYEMAKRAQEMPVDNVVVYCVSCIKAMHIGGKIPRYIVDLLFGESTPIGVFEPSDWHKELDEYTCAQASPQK